MREAKKSMRPNNSGDRKIMLTRQWSFFFFNLMKQGLVLHQKTLYRAGICPCMSWKHIRGERERWVWWVYGTDGSLSNATQATAKRHEKAHVSIFYLYIFFWHSLLLQGWKKQENPVKSHLRINQQKKKKAKKKRLPVTFFTYQLKSQDKEEYNLMHRDDAEK